MKGRSCKGKRYQEFIEDGRIAVGSRKRRSHRSGGEESEEEMALNLSQDGAAATANNHWKKKQIRTTDEMTENGGVEWRGRKMVAASAGAVRAPTTTTAADQANKAFSVSPVGDGSFQRSRRRLAPMSAHTATSS